MTGDATLSLSGGWRETRFERGAWGPDERDGLVATVERDDVTIEVLPVRYSRRGGTETVDSVLGEWDATRKGLGVPVTRAGPVTGFATRLTYAPYESERQEAICVATDADDALAIGCWLADVTESAKELRRHVNRHAGMGSPDGVGGTLSDDDVLGAVFAEEPERCVLTGVETSSHEITLPFRYVPLLSGARRTPKGVPRFPATVDSLTGLVSHDAWTEHDLDDVDFEAPIERVESGVYELSPTVVDAVAGADAEAFALRRLAD